MKTGNGQSKYCINGPIFTRVVGSITASLFGKNILHKLELCIQEVERKKGQHLHVDNAVSPEYFML